MSELGATASAPTPQPRLTTAPPATTTVDLAARGEQDPRPDRAAPLDDRVRQLAAAGRTTHRPPQRAARRAARGGQPSEFAPPAEVMAQSGASAGHDGSRGPGDRSGPPRLGQQGATGPDRGRPQVRPVCPAWWPLRRSSSASTWGRSTSSSRSRLRHRSRAGCSGSAGRGIRSGRPLAGCSSPTIAAIWSSPRSSWSGCGGRDRGGCRATQPAGRAGPAASWRPSRSRSARSDELYALCAGRAPYADLPRSAFEAVLDMLSGRYPVGGLRRAQAASGLAARHGVADRSPGAQRLAVTSGGTIPDRGLFGVFLVGEGSASGKHAPGRRVGELDEEMVYETRVGDVFTLGTTSWRVEQITHDQVLVSPAPGTSGPAAVLEGRLAGPAGRAGRRIRRVRPQAGRDAA